MTPQEHAHAQALNESHDLFGGRPADAPCDWLTWRDHWVAEREKHITAAENPVRSTT